MASLSTFTLFSRLQTELQRAIWVCFIAQTTLSVSAIGHDRVSAQQHASACGLQPTQSPKTMCWGPSELDEFDRRPGESWDAESSADGSVQSR